MNPHDMPDDDRNFRLERRSRNLDTDTWVTTDPPNLFKSIDEARREVSTHPTRRAIAQFKGSGWYRIVDVRSGKVYEATGGEPLQCTAIETAPIPGHPNMVQPPESMEGAFTHIATPAGPVKVIAGGEYQTKTVDTKLAEGSMVRSPDTGKTDYALTYRGPMLRRWAELLSRGAVVYGADNWLEGLREADPAIRARIKRRYKKSAARHFWQWMMGQRDEDHAAAVYFNLNGYEAMVWTDDATTRAERIAELEALTE